MQPNRRILIAVLFLTSNIWTIPVQSVHASPVSTSLPGVVVGDNATYVFTSVSFQTTNSTAFPTPFFPPSLRQSTKDIVLSVLNVVGANVTFSLTFYFVNGTSSLGEIQNVDVQTQSFCVTSPGVVSIQSFCSLEQMGSLIIASGLQAPDTIGTNPSIMLNQTVPLAVLGAQRTVNVMSVTTNPSPCYTVYGATGCLGTQTLRGDFVWDQASGVAVMFGENETVTSVEGTATGSFAIGLSSTNIFGVETPDFAMTSNPSSVTIQGGRPGSSTVTLISLSGFTGTVTLRVSTSSSQLSCSLSQTSIVVSNTSSVTLSCRGSAGTYTVTITGSAGSLSHSTIVAFTVLHGHRRPR